MKHGSTTGLLFYPGRTESRFIQPDVILILHSRIIVTSGTIKLRAVKFVIICKTYSNFEFV